MRYIVKESIYRRLKVASTHRIIPLNINTINYIQPNKNLTFLDTKNLVRLYAIVKLLGPGLDSGLA